jgi:pectate lyase
MLDFRGHDVIVHNMRLRNGGDNLRAQRTAYNIVFDHISSTGSHDDGISIGYGAHDVTVQYSFLAGNTRSIFIKYNDTDNISIHHTWVMKQWIRGPLASASAMVDFRNNIVEDWQQWGVRYEDGASGNVINSIFGEGDYATSRFGNQANALNNISSNAVYFSGNVFQGHAKLDTKASSATELPAPHVSTQSVADMEKNVRANAGAMPRDAIDQQYIDLKTGWSLGESSPLRF